MDKGIYCLVISHPPCSVRIGALGELGFPTRFHVYIGSAQGSGGLKRLDRHFRIATSRNTRPKWHVDYLLTDPRFTLEYAVYAPTAERLECRLVAALGNHGTTGFGCSDCTCTSHLLFRNTDPKEEILDAFRRLNLQPAIKTIITPDAKDNI